MGKPVAQTNNRHLELLTVLTVNPHGAYLSNKKQRSIIFDHFFIKWVGSNKRNCFNKTFECKYQEKKSVYQKIKERNWPCCLNSFGVANFAAIAA